MTHFPETLRTWRKARRFSQLELAIEADVSTRHISFLETGRASPSRDMVGRLGDALRLPLSARNQLLTQAGFAARYVGREWDDDDMAPIRAAIDHMLRGHAPYPALAVDRLWTVLRMNVPAQRLFGPLGVSEGDSLLELMLSDELRAVIENWEDVAHHAAQRLWTESAAHGGIAELDRVANILSNVERRGDAIGPVVPTIYRTPSARLCLFATIAQFGTPNDDALDDMKIEFYFPADAASDAALRAMDPEG